MKKIASLISVCILAVALVGCGGNKPESEEKTPANSSAQAESADQENIAAVEGVYLSPLSGIGYDFNPEDNTYKLCVEEAVYESSSGDEREYWDDYKTNKGRYNTDGKGIELLLETPEFGGTCDGGELIIYKDSLIDYNSILEGDIPDGKTFDAEFTEKDGDIQKFKSDGTFAFYSTNFPSYSGTYERNGNSMEIIVNGYKGQYIIYDNSLYANVYEKRE